jgi:dynein assembly factor 5
MDDSSDDIRRATCATLIVYFDCFESGYNVALYRAHLEAMYKGLLVHLDDPEASIQEAVLGGLATLPSIFPH